MEGPLCFTLVAMLKWHCKHIEYREALHMMSKIIANALLLSCWTCQNLHNQDVTAEDH